MSRYSSLLLFSSLHINFNLWHGKWPKRHHFLNIDLALLEKPHDSKTKISWTISMFQQQWRYARLVFACLYWLTVFCLWCTDQLSILKIHKHRKNCTRCGLDYWWNSHKTNNEWALCAPWKQGKQITVEFDSKFSTRTGSTDWVCNSLYQLRSMKSVSRTGDNSARVLDLLIWMLLPRCQINLWNVIGFSNS